MFKKIPPPRLEKLPMVELLARIQSLDSGRPVRPVVTRSGHRARGHVPAFKRKDRARFESLVEDDVLRLLDMAPSVRSFRTHPVVLELVADDGREFSYTTDVLLELCTEEGALLEVKGDAWLKHPPSVARMRQINRLMKRHGLPWSLLPEKEARQQGLHEELRLLARERPAVPRHRLTLDLNAWDPAHGMPCPPHLKGRWEAARAACDEILARAMRRDPDDLLPAVTP